MFDKVVFLKIKLYLKLKVDYVDFFKIFKIF